MSTPSGPGDGDPGRGVARDRVVAVVAILPGGREQVGTGFLLTETVVLTARHCTRDKTTGRPASSVRVVRASDGQVADQLRIVASTVLDVAVLELTDPPWAGADLPPPGFARVDRAHTGMLSDCVAVGYPLFQYDPGTHARETAELHGVIYQTDGAETGRLLMREPLLSSVSVPAGTDPAPIWGGLSGATVFHHDRAIGVIVEHHPRQGASAVQLVALEQILEQSSADTSTRAVSDLLGLPAADLLPWATAEPVLQLAGIVSQVDAAGGLPRLADLNPYRLGASPSDYGNQETYGRHDPYVARTAHNVDARVRAALEPGRLVLLVGPSKAGKTRTAFEAAKARWPDARLVVPAPGSLTALAGHPRLQASSDPVLVWLDDLQRYLTGADPLTPALLARLTSRPGPTVLLATLRSEERDKLRQDIGEFATDTRAVLQAAEPSTIELGHTSTDPAEQAAADTAYPDTHLDTEVGGAGLAETLAHAPALLTAYRDSAAAHPLRHAVVRTVIDWVRAGLARPVPEPDLITLTRDTLWTERPDLDPDDAQLAEAISWARTGLPGTGHAALLHTHPLPGHIRGYRPFDYLTAADNGQDGHPRPVPEAFWDQLLPYATPQDAADIGNAAYYRNNPSAALTAFRKAAEAGDLDALRKIGYLLAFATEPPDLPAARAAFQQAADAGNSDAAFNLGNLLATQLDPPDVDAARAAFQQAADAGHRDAAHNLGVLLATQLDPPDLPAARMAYQQAADAGHRDAAFSLGVLLADQLDPPDLDAARAALQQAADAGHGDAAFRLGILLADQLDPPDLDAARIAYQQAADAGHPGGANNLGVLLATRLDPPDVGAARAAFQQAADAGLSDAANSLGNLLADLLDPPDLNAARTAYQQAADAGHRDAAYNLGVLLADLLDPPDLEAARTAYQQAADADDPDAANNLGVLLATRLDPPDLDAARAAFQQAADADDPDAANNLGDLLADLLDPPDLNAARTAYQQAADAGNTYAAYKLGCVEARLGDAPAATEAWQRALDREPDDVTISALVSLATLTAVDDIGKARELLRTAATHGFELADDFAAVLDPATRVEASARLSALTDPDSLNFRGLAALADGDPVQARRLWTRSRDQQDEIAPLLLRHTTPS